MSIYSEIIFEFVSNIFGSKTNLVNINSFQPSVSANIHDHSSVITVAS
jgi:hypothetical protein